jgi:2-methylisocitrate lyase-like PEP mutase family enzyme
MSGDNRSSFRDLHHRAGAFIIPNPWDVGSAKILASMGFEALATTSAGFAFSCGVVEGDVTPSAVLNHCRAIVEATPLPVSADLEKGFGDSPQAVAETIRRAAETGLAGGSIEDFSGDTRRPIFDLALAVERIAAAAEAAAALERDFVLTARAESFLHGRPDLDDTIRRLQAFDAAGADVLYAPGLRELDQIRTICEATSKPVNVIMGLSGVTFDVAQLTAVGVKRISVGSALARLAYGGLIRAAQEMRQAGTFTFAEGAAGFVEIESRF